MEEYELDRDTKRRETLDDDLKNFVFRPHQVIRPRNVGTKHIIKSMAMVVWEDITAYTRVEIPDDFELFRLTKITVGILWQESKDYLVLVQDYDLSNRGKGYKHNDFHIIPRGAVKDVRLLGEIEL